ncbi:MAG: alcohol dehydrogenase catalytic domain-containing protein, partial [Anaerolineales bacterium]|nr:alcohol dehydrogenase catalytic domain-containing protein [Anaerolineales bacterium]
RNDDVRLEEMPKPTIGAGEVLVRVVASGICGSDVMEWYRTKTAPRVLGHEVTGEITSLGEGVTGFDLGERVVFTHHVPCNDCGHCLRGQHTLCSTLHSTSFDPGGFAEYVRVPKINVDKGGVLSLPEELSFEVGTFIEPLGCVVRGQRRICLQPGDSVLVLGSGLAGLLNIRLARVLGAGCIVATDMQSFRLQAALDSGAQAAIDAALEHVVERVLAANDGNGFEHVIVCTAASGVFAQALSAVAPGGNVLLYAFSGPGVETLLDLHDYFRKSTTIRSTYGASPLDLRQAVNMLRFGSMEVEDLITHRLSLAETGRGFSLVASGTESLKVIIEPGR